MIAKPQSTVSLLAITEQISHLKMLYYLRQFCNIIQTGINVYHLTLCLKNSFIIEGDS